MGNWTDAQRTVRQLADIINDKCLISFRTPEDNQENSTKVTCIYVSLIPLEGYIPALKWMPNLMAMIFNHLTADRKLIYQQFTDNHSFFTIHPCDWKKDSEKLFSDPETDYAFDQAIIAHQIIDIFNEICAIQFPEISRKPVFEVFIGMATGSYDYAEPLPQDKKTLMEMKFKRDAGELVITHEPPCLANWTTVHKKALSNARKRIYGYTDTLSGVQENGVFMDWETFSALRKTNRDLCNYTDKLKDQSHTRAYNLYYDDFKKIYIEFGSVDTDAVIAFEKKHDRNVGSPRKRSQLENMDGQS